MAGDQGRNGIIEQLQAISDEQLQDLHRAVRKEWKRRGLGREKGNETGAESREDRGRRRQRGNDPVT